jgi:hypothetical protein
MSDWIEDYLVYTKEHPTVETYRLWCGIAAIGGVLGRNVWVPTSAGKLYPNLYVILVGGPGAGKSQAIRPVEDLWASTGNLHIAADSLTKAGLVDELSGAYYRNPKSEIEASSLLICSSEFGNLVPAHDLEYLSVFNHIYDNPRSYTERRRSLEVQPQAIEPQMHILAGVQPGYLSSLLPEVAWSMGFTSRLSMIYSGIGVDTDILVEVENKRNEVQRASLLHRLKDMSLRFGVQQLDEDYKTRFRAWIRAGEPPRPTHSKLVNYLPRRQLTMLKLSTISAVSKGRKSTVVGADFDRAADWLFSAERVMPDIFRDMDNKSDKAVYTELAIFTSKLYANTGKPISLSIIANYLKDRVPTEKVSRIIGMAETTGVLTRIAGTDTYKPSGRSVGGTLIE